MRNITAFAFGATLLGVAGLAAGQNEVMLYGQGNNNGSNYGTIQSTLYDNGLPNGVNGYSNAVDSVFGARRTILDDFRIGDPNGWRITDFHWRSVWNSEQPGHGSSMELSFRADDNGTPGAVVATANITNYMETGTGNSYFSRPEAEHWADFDAIDLGPGTYWFEATVVGGDNNFWLTADQQGNECWVNYDDLGGLQSGSTVFGAPSDVNFIITGEIIPTPGSLALLGLGGLAFGTRRRRA